jgi:hypothetical protein
MQMRHKGFNPMISRFKRMYTIPKMDKPGKKTNTNFTNNSNVTNKIIYFCFYSRNSFPSVHSC